MKLIKTTSPIKWYTYKGYNLVRTGTREIPWNIYRPDGYGYGDWVGCGKTLRDCKFDIDNGCFSVRE